MKSLFSFLCKRVKAKVNPSSCVNHDWKHVGVTKHFWGLNPDGSSYGMYSDIAYLMAKYSELSTVREQFPKLMEWREKGFNACHTSWDHYKCKNCGRTYAEEFYTHPHKRTPPTAKDKEALDRVIKMVC